MTTSTKTRIKLIREAAELISRDRWIRYVAAVDKTGAAFAALQKVGLRTCDIVEIVINCFSPKEHLIALAKINDDYMNTAEEISFFLHFN